MFSICRTCSFLWWKWWKMEASGGENGRKQRIIGWITAEKRKKIVEKRRKGGFFSQAQQLVFRSEYQILRIKHME